MWPADAGARAVQIGTTKPSCVPVIVPDELSTDLSLPTVLCRGERLLVKTKHSRRVVRGPGLKVKEKESKEKLLLPRGAGLERRVAEVPDVFTLAERTGASIRQENKSVDYETPDFSYSKDEEDTRVRGDDFDYDLEESRVQTEENGVSTEERESEERYEVRP
jgi:hypothetical protein